MTKKKEVDKKMKTGRGPNTTDAERLAMIHWLKNEENRNLILGAAASGPVKAGKQLKKSDAHKALASAVTKAQANVWTQQMAKSRFQSYYDLYKKAKRESNGTGFGVTDDDRTRDITTVEQKLDSLCPFFADMDDIFGNKPNVSPPSISESAVLSDDQHTDNESDHASHGLTSTVTGASSEFHDTSMETTTSSDVEMSSKELQPATPLSAKGSNIKFTRIPSAKTPKRKDFSSTYMEAQEALRELKRQAMEAERERAQKELNLREQELRIKEEEIKMVKEQSEMKLKEETRRIIFKSLIEQGMKAPEIKEFMEQMGH